MDEIANWIPPLFYGGILLFLLMAVSALWYRFGNTQRELGALSVQVAGTQSSLTEKTASLQASIDEETASLQASIDEKTADLRTYIDEKNAELRAYIDEKTAVLDEKFAALQASSNEKFAALQASVDALLKAQHEMQLQMQRNHYQIMMAILSHSHRADGRPVFDLPPDMEPPSTA